MKKTTIASVWLESCAGCHMSFLDVDERITTLLESVELTYTPITDIKTIPQVDIGIIEGGLGNEEEVHLAKELRSKCKILIAWGDCAVFGGINCMRNFIPVQDVLRGGYVDTVTTVNPEAILPGQDLPKLLPKALGIDTEVAIDVHVPGCPPDADTILYVFTELLRGNLPKLPPSMMRFD
ncbi:hydrogenase [Fundidesulfovibrio butyratiphilus]